MVFLFLNRVIMIKGVDMTSINGLTKDRGALLNNIVGCILNPTFKITHISNILTESPKWKLPAQFKKNSFMNIY